MVDLHCLPVPDLTLYFSRPADWKPSLQIPFEIEETQQNAGANDATKEQAPFLPCSQVQCFFGN